MNAHLKRYLEAVTDLLKQGGDLKEVLKETRVVMERKGHLKLYPSLLRALTRTYPATLKQSRPTLVLAKNGDETKYQKLIDKEVASVIIDPSIIGGHLYTKDFIREDNSYKSKLLTWYRRATKN